MPLSRPSRRSRNQGRPLPASSHHQNTRCAHSYHMYNFFSVPTTILTHTSLLCMDRIFSTMDVAMRRANACKSPEEVGRRAGSPGADCTSPCCRQCPASCAPLSCLFGHHTVLYKWGSAKRSIK
jgi:hypothetical protein